jgi:hypothetical protein
MLAQMNKDLEAKVKQMPEDVESAEYPGPIFPADATETAVVA